jgi:hypothetical protein
VLEIYWYRKKCANRTIIMAVGAQIEKLHNYSKNDLSLPWGYTG